MMQGRGPIASRWGAGGVVEDFKGAGFPQAGKRLGGSAHYRKNWFVSSPMSPSTVLTQKRCTDFAIFMQFLTILAKLCLHHSPLRNAGLGPSQKTK